MLQRKYSNSKRDSMSGKIAQVAGTTKRRKATRKSPLHRHSHCVFTLLMSAAHSATSTHQQRRDEKEDLSEQPQFDWRANFEHALNGHPKQEVSDPAINNQNPPEND